VASRTEGPGTAAGPTYGPSAIATPANGVTLIRVLITPLLLVWILDSGASWPAEALWIVLSLTDGIDGFLARRHGATRSGAFLDPLADKFLVLGGMVALVSIDVFGWVPVALIAVREVAMSVYRAVVGRVGVSIPARRSAKWKTFVQDLAVALALLPGVGDDHPGVARLVLWAAVVLTLVTGAQYLQDARRTHAV
jgi:CDP-diacylglycerol--glycerol-3-phosphate 3-phosphatidyltransferase